MNLLKHFQKSSEIKKGKFVFYLDVDPEDEDGYLRTELARLQTAPKPPPEAKNVTKAPIVSARAAVVLARIHLVLRRPEGTKK